MAKRIEILVHILFWVLLFSSINVEWTSNWFDTRIRPKSPAPLSVIMFFVFFYVNAFVLIPKYFALSTWKKYILHTSILFILPELIRIGIYQYTISELSVGGELFGRDSFLFGAPSPFMFALNASFVYSLSKAWLLNKRQANKSEETEINTIPYKDSNILTEKEASLLEKAIMNQLKNEKIYLIPDLALRDLAAKVGSTENKVSYLLNQSLKTNFYELMNSFRVEKFKTEIAKPENRKLSILGLAYNCGFPSKSSFYRAFKSQVSMSPSEYIKKISKNK